MYNSESGVTNLEVLRLKGEQKDHWMQLCEKAANEQDPEKLVELVREITRLLEEKEQRLQSPPHRG